MADLIGPADYVFNSDEWEFTADARELHLITDELDYRGVAEIGRLQRLPSVFAARVPVGVIDADGDPEDWEVRLFATREEALEAAALPSPGADQ